MSRELSQYYESEDARDALQLFEDYGLTGILQDSNNAADLIDSVIELMTMSMSDREAEFWRAFGEKLLSVVHTAQAQIEEAYTAGYAAGVQTEQLKMLQEFVEQAARIESGEYWQDDN